VQADGDVDQARQRAGVNPADTVEVERERQQRQSGAGSGKGKGDKHRIGDRNP
jgi:hypothetical protein